MFDAIPLTSLERAQLAATSPSPKVVFYKDEVDQHGEVTVAELVTVYLDAGATNLRHLVPFLRSEGVHTCEAHGAVFFAQEGRMTRVANPRSREVGANPTFTPSTQDRTQLLMQKTLNALTKKVQQLEADPTTRKGPLRAVNKPKPEVTEDETKTEVLESVKDKEEPKEKPQEPATPVEE